MNDVEMRMECLRLVTQTVSDGGLALQPDEILALAERFADFVKGGDGDLDRIDGGMDEPDLGPDVERADKSKYPSEWGSWTGCEMRMASEDQAGQSAQAEMVRRELLRSMRPAQGVSLGSMQHPTQKPRRTRQT